MCVMSATRGANACREGSSTPGWQQIERPAGVPAAVAVSYQLALENQRDISKHGPDAGQRR